jgi:hypothetical protein
MAIFNKSNEQNASKVLRFKEYVFLFALTLEEVYFITAWRILLFNFDCNLACDWSKRRNHGKLQFF